MPAEPKPSTPMERAIGAGLLILLGLFLGGITVAVLGARAADGDAVTAFFIRAFFTLIVGGIAVFVTALGVKQLRAKDEPKAKVAARKAKEVPEVLVALCPGCGERATDDPWCPRCDHPTRDRAVRWGSEEKSWVGSLFMFAMGSGLLLFGGFLAFGSLMEGERRWAVVIAFLGLGGMVALVGAAMLFGTALMVVGDLRGVTEWKYSWHGEEPLAIHDATARALVIRGRLVQASGNAVIERSMNALPPRAPSALVPLQRAFARVVTTLYRADLLGMWSMRRIEWTTGEPPKRPAFAQRVDAPPPTRKDETRIMARPHDVAPTGELRDACALLVRHLEGDRPVRDVWRDVQADAEAREKWLAVKVVEKDGEEPLEGVVAAEIATDLMN